MNPAHPSTHHCGRLDLHPAHAWQSAYGSRRVRPVYYCTGHPVHPTVRCDTWNCHTTVDLDEDPAALCDTCHLVTCDRCHHICTGNAA